MYSHWVFYFNKYKNREVSKSKAKANSTIKKNSFKNCNTFLLIY